MLRFNDLRTILVHLTKIKNMKVILTVITFLCFKILVLGQSPQNDFSFDPGNAFVNSLGSDPSRTINTQIDGKIIIGGGFQSFNGYPAPNLCRLNSNGALDLTFNIGSGFSGTYNMFFGSSVYTTAIQNDGKIIVGGNFLSFNGINKFGICRLNQNGTIDPSFNSLTGFNGAVRKVCLQSDGKIIVGGDFTTYNSTTVNRICRLNPDGTLDTSFNIGLGFNSPQSESVYDLVIQQDGKIIVGGYFSQFNGVSKHKILRLNTNGTLDASFNIGSGFGSGGGGIWSMALQTDGKILIAGMLYVYNGQSISNICRLNTNGSLDLSFLQGSGFNNPTFSVSVQSNGKIVIGGQFSSYNGTNRSNIIRLNSNGIIDATFDCIPGSGLNDMVLCTHIQANNQILVGGAFTAINNLQRNGIVRLLNTTNLTVCSGEELNFNLSNLQIPGNVTYQWNAINNPNIIGESIFAQNSSVLGDTLINSDQLPQIVVYSITPIINNIPSSVINFTVTVNPIPIALANPPSQTVCCQSSSFVSFISNSEYEWNANLNSNAGGYPINGNANFTAILDNYTSIAQTVDYNLIPTLTNNGVTCIGDTQYFNITVLPCPGSLTASNLVDQYLCSGDTTDELIIEGTANSYDWFNYNFNNNVNLPFSGQDTIPSFLVENNTSSIITYSLYIIPTYSSLCPGIGDTLFFYVYPSPTINAGSDLLICEGQQVILEGSGGSNYQWNNSVIDGVPFSPSSSQEYVITGEDVNGCTGSDTTNVFVNPVTYSNQIVTALDSFTWPVNNQTYSQSGTYTHTLVNAAGCDSIITMNLTLDFTGLVEDDFNFIEFFPNPATTQLIIRLKSNLIISPFEITDQAGKILLNGVLNDFETLVSLNDFSNGLYFIKIRDKGIYRFVVQKE
jgi:uncharacterized delta-60 repeat protein